MATKKKEEFFDREISWLSFNERVLQEANDPDVPLIERVRFLGIFSNNLDEFFKVRVATIRRLAMYSKRTKTPLGHSPEEILTQIHDTVVAQQKRHERIFRHLEGELDKQGIFIRTEKELTNKQKAFVNDYFNDKVRPLLVPLMVDRKSKFPALRDGIIYLSIKLWNEEEKNVKYALIELPDLPRFVELPKSKGNHYVMFLDDVIRFKLKKIFPIFEFDHIEAFTIKITRDAELDIDEDISQGLIEKMSNSIAKRKRGDYVRFVYDKNIPDDLLDFILKKMKVYDMENVIAGGKYHNKRDLMSFPDFGRSDLIFPKLPALAQKDLKGQSSLLSVIEKKDVLLHYPYQNFGNIIDLLREAAIDPHVKNIRITLYRVAEDSNIINALINASKNGKKVTVVVELQARFDETNNIYWSSQLQEAGVKVIFGVQGLKVHSKLFLITRKVGNKKTRFAHIGTGNFHEKTARIYSDISLLTSDKKITNEVKKIFNFFDSNFQRGIFKHLIVSPYSTRRKFMALINKEIKRAEKGEEAWIDLKLNNLVDAGMIRKLYEASQAGVKVRAIVRGICSLIPGVKGKSENIQVISIVGRFLEHSRIMVFSNGGSPLYFISSADWMTRNLDHRIEVTAPVSDPELQLELRDYLDIQFSDNVKARLIDRKLQNHHVKPGEGEKAVNSHREVYEYFKKKLD
ncbi:polyphosphate kinase 1 [Halocola ammonii]